MLCVRYLNRFDLVNAGLPVADPCYARFSRRHGRDGFLYGDYNDACAFSKNIALGQCPAVAVVGGTSDMDFAVTTGEKSSICISRILQGGILVNAGAQVYASCRLIVVTLLFILMEGLQT